MNLGSVCRCCLSEGGEKQLSFDYYHAGEKEVYADMLMDTFNLTVSEHAQLKQLICEACISKLHDATNFKKLVVATEDTLMKMLSCKPDEDEVKTEPTSDLDDDYDNTTSDRYNDDFAWELGDNLTSDDAGKVFVIKSEPEKNETHTELQESSTETVMVTRSAKTARTAKPAKTDKTAKSAKKAKVAKKVTGSKKDGNNKVKTPKPKTSVGNMKIAKISAKPKDSKKKECIPISENQIISRENSLKLILNSNLCLFKSLKTKFGCFHCKESYLNMAELREHSKNHSNIRHLQLRINSLRGMSYRNVDISSLSCKTCDEKCTNLDELRTHLTDKHKIPFGDGDHFLIPYNLENGLKCVLCEQKFNTFTRMAIHMNTHYVNNVCEICGVSYINRLSLRMHVNSVHKEKKCSICSAMFVSHYLRVKHMMKVHNIGEHKRYCMLCSKTFRYSYMLEEHRIQEHGVKRQISNCPECGKTFLSPQNLKVHIRSVHVKERNYPCDICGMRFFTKCDQKRHERTHEDVRSFACAHCEGRFKTKDSWRRHQRRQHPHAPQNK